MSVRDLIPWGRNNGKQMPSLYRDDNRDPFLSLHREMNWLFDDAFRSFDSRLPGVASLSSHRAGWPNIEVAETDKEIKLTAEVPGLDEKDIKVLPDDDVLTLRGEKRAETKDRDKQFSQRFYGSFRAPAPARL